MRPRAPALVFALALLALHAPLAGAADGIDPAGDVSFTRAGCLAPVADIVTFMVGPAGDHLVARVGVPDAETWIRCGTTREIVPVDHRVEVPFQDGSLVFRATFTLRGNALSGASGGAIYDVEHVSAEGARSSFIERSFDVFTAVPGAHGIRWTIPLMGVMADRDVGTARTYDLRDLPWDRASASSRIEGLASVGSDSADLLLPAVV